VINISKGRVGVKRGAFLVVDDDNGDDAVFDKSNNNNNNNTYCKIGRNVAFVFIKFAAKPLSRFLVRVLAR